MWGKFPKGGRGLTQTHSIFFSVFSNSGAYKMAKKYLKKTVKNVKIPNLGEGGPPLGNFSHIIPFFADNVPNWLREVRFANPYRCFNQICLLLMRKLIICDQFSWSNMNANNCIWMHELDILDIWKCSTDVVDRPTQLFYIWIFICWVGGGELCGHAELSFRGSSIS